MPNKPETPAEWARFCAEKVMGWPVWEQATTGTKEKCVTRPTNRPSYGPSLVLGVDWSPYENLADAREVLEELSCTTEPQDPWTRRWRIDKRDDNCYTVALSNVLPVQPELPARLAFTPGPHEGPAICELAWKLKGETPHGNH